MLDNGLDAWSVRRSALEIKQPDLPRSGCSVCPARSIAEGTNVLSRIRKRKCWVERLEATRECEKC